MRGTKLVGDFMRRVFSPSAYNDSPFCRDGIGQGVSRRAGSLALTAGTGSGPEGSRPTAGNRRLQDRGEEKADGSTGTRCFWQPPAHPPKMICHFREPSPVRLSIGSEISRDPVVCIYETCSIRSLDLRSAMWLLIFWRPTQLFGPTTWHMAVRLNRWMELQKSASTGTTDTTDHNSRKAICFCRESTTLRVNLL